ncbi:hypothetical protein HYX11_00980, partial [Candidatus Woesearchaeota archaeon]|nr:hypothetical protein [Candidatus Woesearchaeota archaeon]
AFDSPQGLSTFSGVFTFPKVLDPSNVKVSALSSNVAMYNKETKKLAISYPSDVTLTSIATITFTATSAGDITSLAFKVDDTKTFDDKKAKVYSAAPAEIKMSVSSPPQPPPSAKDTGTTPSPPSPPPVSLVDGAECTDKGIYSDTSFYCDGEVGMKCNSENEGVIKDKVKCVSNKWEQCINKFCPTGDDLKKGGMLTMSYKKIDSKGDTIAKSADINENTLFYNVLNEQNKKIVYFKYKQKNYQIELIKSDSYEGTAEVQVKSLADGLMKGKLLLALTQDSPTIFPATQLGLNLDNVPGDEVYILASGYFLSNIAGVMLVVEPALNFDVFGESKVVLASNNIQKFTFNGQHTISAVISGEDGVMFIDGKEYVNGGMHYFDAKKTQFVNIKKLELGQMAVFSLSTISQGVKESYEDTFTQERVVEKLKVCVPDLASIFTLKVCDEKDVNVFNLNDKEVYVNQQTYQDKLVSYNAPDIKGNASKEGKIFYLVSGLAQAQNQEGLTFTNNMAQGKRLALEVEGNYYVLSHPQAKYMDLTQLKLTDISNKDQPQYIAEGNQEEVVFNLPLGKQINVKLNLDPDLGYDISARTAVKNVADLEKQLQAQFSTYGSALINSMEVSVAENDIKTYMDTVKVSGIGIVKELKYQKPVISGDGQKILWYYNTFAVAGANTFNKYIKAYLYYDLTKSKGEHTFTDMEFTLPLVKGAQLALGIEENYYLLGYSEPWDPLTPIGFTLNKLQLTKLGSKEIYSAEVTKEGVQFKVEGRIISVSVNSLDNKIMFSGKTIAEAAKKEVDLEQEYAAKLPPENEAVRNLLEIKDSGKGYKYYNCDTSSTKLLKDFFLLCDSVTVNPLTGKDLPMQIDMNLVKEFKEEDEPNFVVWYKASQSGEKNIWLQKVIEVKENTPAVFDDWDLMTSNLVNGQNPAVKFSTGMGEEYYELTGGRELNSFMLKKIPLGEELVIQMQSTKEGYNNGTIVVGDKLVFFRQYLEDYNIKLEISLLIPKLVTTDFVNVTGGEVNNAEFLTGVGGQAYNLIVTKDKDNKRVIVDIAEADREPVFRTKLVVGASKKVLLPNGDIVSIEVEEMKEGSPVVAIKRAG